MYAHDDDMGQRLCTHGAARADDFQSKEDIRRDTKDGGHVENNLTA